MALITGCPPDTANPSQNNVTPNARDTNINSTPPNTFNPNFHEPNFPEPNFPEPNPPEPNLPIPLSNQNNIPEPNLIQKPPVEPVNNTTNNSTTDPNVTDSNSPKDPNLGKTYLPDNFYKEYAAFLKKYVTKNGKVKYKSLRRNRIRLTNITKRLENIDPKKYKSWHPDDQLAYRTNIYNLQMLRIIINNYPIKRVYFRAWDPPTSISHIKGIWSDHKFMVMDEQFNLNQFADRFFKKKFYEPRIFFALNRASHSAPPFRNEPYYGKKLDKQLNDQMKKFFASGNAFKINRKRHKVQLSVIFKTVSQRQDFIKQYGTNKKFKDKKPQTRALLNFILKYVPKKDIPYLETGDYTVENLMYDWRLNE